MEQKRNFLWSERVNRILTGIIIVACTLLVIDVIKLKAAEKNKKAGQATPVVVVKPDDAAMVTKWKMDYSPAGIIKTFDPRAVVTGTSDGIFNLTLKDAGAYHGHVCYHTAGAFIMTRLALENLCGDKMPVRGEFRAIAGDRDQLDVVAYITCARSNYGVEFGYGKLICDPKLVAQNGDVEIIFQHAPTGKTVDVTFHCSRLPALNEIEELRLKVLSGKATQEDKVRMMELMSTAVKETLMRQDELFSVTSLPDFKYPEPDYWYPGKK